MQPEVLRAVGSWVICSMGMLVFNKFAIQNLPLACTLVATQMLVTVVFLLVFCRASLHIGSLRDVLLWSRVIPCFTGMLLTSILTLQTAPMSLLVTFRGLTPLACLAVERFLFPTPIRTSAPMIASMIALVVGVLLYVSVLDVADFTGARWALLNNFLAVGDRSLHRLMLGQDQRPVDVSKTGATMLNNGLGIIPLLIAVALTGEYRQLPEAISHIDVIGALWLLASCISGIGISYTGIWAQSVISATTFLIVINASKFGVVVLEATVLRTKQLKSLQVLGAFVAIGASAWYGQARLWIENQDKKDVEMNADTIGAPGHQIAEEEEIPLKFIETEAIEEETNR